MLFQGSMRKLLIYNPETDFALGMPSGIYTPSRKVKAMKARQALLMAKMADSGDLILLPEELQNSPFPSSQPLIALPYADLMHAAGAATILSSELHALDFSDIEIVPWGWNPGLVLFLRKNGVPDYKLPSAEKLAQLKRLSHRRTTITFHEHLKRFGLDEGIPQPVELRSADEAIRWLQRFPDSFLKSPWSSSGRGVLHTAGLPQQLTLNRVRRAIASQGSIMAEPSLGNELDFATEWDYYDAHAQFIGFSIFCTQHNVGYNGNLELDNDALRIKIQEKLQRPIQEVVEAQKRALEATIGHEYSGPLGIDMLALPSGRVNACVEINFRLTMGRLWLEELKRKQSSGH